MTESGIDSIYEFDGWRLIPAQRQLRDADGHAVTMRGKVFDLLLTLVHERGRVVEKAELMEALWPGAVVEENNLNQAMSALRQALGETAQSPRLITTVTGRGYQFVGTVRVVDAAETTGSGDKDRSSRHLFAIVAAAIVAAVIIMLLWPDTPPEPEIATEAVPVLEQFAELTPILVTDFEGSQSEPTLSPDGTMIAWISDSSGTPQVWVKNLQSGDPIQVTNGPYAASSPTWSPDNSYIVYARKGPSGRAIYRVGTLGTPAPQRIIRAGLDPSFALATDALVFTDGQQLFLASGEGGDVRRVEGVPGGPGFAKPQPALSPDASHVAFVHADSGPLGNLWIVPTRGGTARQLTTFTLEDGFAVESPAWAPGGRHIVYSVVSRSGGSRLWQIDIDTGAATPLTAGAGNPGNPVVAASGERLAYTDTRSRWRISSIDPGTGERRSIVDSRNMLALPLASPSGESIVYFAPTPSGAQLFTVGADGQDLQQRTFNDNAVNTLPFWSSDGQSVFYYRDRSLHRLYLDEGRDEQVLAEFHWSSRNWAAAHGARLFFNEFDASSSSRRAVILDLVTGAEAELPVPITAGEWSRTGDEILGFTPEDGLYICHIDSMQCDALVAAGEQVRGRRPKWSRDESSIYFIRHSEKGECCVLWSVDRDGTDLTEVVELTGFELRNSYFGVTQDGRIFYNHHDTSTAEIWLAAVR